MVTIAFCQRLAPGTCWAVPGVPGGGLEGWGGEAALGVWVLAAGPGATLALLLDKGSSCRAGRSHASSPRGRTVGTLPGSVSGTGFLRKREALPSVPARGHQSEFSRGSLLARCPQKCRHRKRAPGCFLPPRPGSPGQGTWRWLRLVL